MILICNPHEPYVGEGKICVFPPIHYLLPPITPAPPTPIYIQYIPEPRVIINLLSVSRVELAPDHFIFRSRPTTLDQLALTR